MQVYHKVSLKLTTKQNEVTSKSFLVAGGIYLLPSYFRRIFFFNVTQATNNNCKQTFSSIRTVNTVTNVTPNAEFTNWTINWTLLKANLIFFKWFPKILPGGSLHKLFRPDPPNESLESRLNINFTSYFMQRYLLVKTR